jgi:hypothetical protein
MGIDWFDDLLEKAEHIPGIGGEIQKLRYAYEIWRKEPADPKPVQLQAQTLDDLYTTASQLSTELNDNLLSLRQKWTGNEALNYLGPEVTFAQVEHGYTPAEPGKGWDMWQRLGMLKESLDYNGAAHHAAKKKLDKIQSLHNDLDTDIKVAGGTLAFMVATVEIPVADIVTDGGGAIALTAEAADAAEMATEVTEAVEAVETVEEIAVTTREFTLAQKITAVVVAGAMIADIVLAPFLIANSDSPAASGTPDTLNPPTAQWSQADQDLLEQLMQEFPDVLADDIKDLIRAGFTPDEIRAILRAGFSHAQIQALVARIRAANQDPHGTDWLGLTAAQIRELAVKVADAVNSSDKDKQLEGTTARALIGDLVAFNKKIYDPATGEVIGEIDIETSDAIIEVTTKKTGKLSQIQKYLNNPLMNPDGKPVILYAPNYIGQATKDIEALNVPVVKTMQDLFDWLRNLP